MAGGALLPLLVAVAWVPLRRSLPNTDVALVLVATVAVAAGLGGRFASVLGALSGAVSFEFFHTVPYEHWSIDRPRDVETTVLVALVGVLVGELTLRVFRHRAAAARGSADLAVLAETAELLAVGDDPALVVGAVGGELVRLLELSDCELGAGPPDGNRPWVTREGTLAGPRASGTEGAAGIDLPVWVQGRVIARYRLEWAGDWVPRQDRLALAVSLADQAGAALAAAWTSPPETPGGEPRLRLVSPTEPGGSPQAGAGGPTGPATRARRPARPATGTRAS